MSTLLLTVALIGTIMFLMALGVIISGRVLRGSCGGPGTACQCRSEGKPLHSCDTEAPIIELDALQLKQD
ncbi:hypothetical protein KKF91_09640 [Myxococcota bacterium]|nr:hypothetical protein [Myxococcota bacterium]MBU1430804.1 hypothetical protein [Myxococcota bacterium]MBU1900112.1 hypothetical protein [Myxococcota bacterium]